MSKPLMVLMAAMPLLAAPDARKIIEESQRRAQVSSEHYEGTIDVFRASKTRTIRWTFDRIGSAGESRSLVTFSAPKEIAGLKLLIINHPDRSSEQWMWTPSLQRERRVAVQDRSTRFFGTDFSFEDLEERDVAQYDYKLLGQETLDGVKCWKIESKATGQKVSQYTSSLLWIREDNYVPVRIQNYIGDNLARRLDYGDLIKLDNIWTPRRIEVFDPRLNSRTVLKIGKLEYNVPMNADDFTVEALRNSAAATPHD